MSSFENFTLERSGSLVAEAGEEQAPPRWWARLVASERFDTSAAAVICLNACVMAVELEYQGSQRGSDAEEWAPAETVFLVADILFCLIFGAELGLRMATYGLAFVRNFY